MIKWKWNNGSTAQESVIPHIVFLFLLKSFDQFKQLVFYPVMELIQFLMDLLC